MTATIIIPLFNLISAPYWKLYLKEVVFLPVWT